MTVDLRNEEDVDWLEESRKRDDEQDGAAGAVSKLSGWVGDLLGLGEKANWTEEEGPQGGTRWVSDEGDVRYREPADVDKEPEDGSELAKGLEEGDEIVVDGAEGEIETLSDMGGGYYVAIRDDQDEVHTARVGPNHEFEKPSGGEVEDDEGDSPDGPDDDDEAELSDVSARDLFNDPDPSGREVEVRRHGPVEILGVDQPSFSDEPGLEVRNEDGDEFMLWESTADYDIEGEYETGGQVDAEEDAPDDSGGDATPDDVDPDAVPHEVLPDDGTWDDERQAAEDYIEGLLGTTVRISGGRDRAPMDKTGMATSAIEMAQRFNDTVDAEAPSHVEIASESQLASRTGYGSINGYYDWGDDSVSVAADRMAEMGPLGDDEDQVTEGGISAVDDPAATLLHEMMHAAHRQSMDGAQTPKDETLSPGDREALEENVSDYSAENPIEAVAEIATGLAYGADYPDEVMEIYERYQPPEVDR